MQREKTNTFQSGTSSQLRFQPRKQFSKSVVDAINTVWKSLNKMNINHIFAIPIIFLLGKYKNPSLSGNYGVHQDIQLIPISGACSGTFVIFHYPQNRFEVYSATIKASNIWTDCVKLSKVKSKKYIRIIYLIRTRFRKVDMKSEI